MGRLRGFLALPGLGEYVSWPGLPIHTPQPVWLKAKTLTLLWFLRLEVQDSLVSAAGSVPSVQTAAFLIYSNMPSLWCMWMGKETERKGELTLGVSSSRVLLWDLI